MMAPRQAAMSVLVALSVTHLRNDMIQSLIAAIYPITKTSYGPIVRWSTSVGQSKYVLEVW